MARRDRQHTAIVSVTVEMRGSIHDCSADYFRRKFEENLKDIKTAAAKYGVVIAHTFEFHDGELP